MTVEFNPAVEQDLAEAVAYYDTKSQRLGDDFLDEFRKFVNTAANNPDRFHVIGRGFHRANLKRFPYHFLYLKTAIGIRITLIRHHRRNPEFGMERK